MERFNTVMATVIPELTVRSGLGTHVQIGELPVFSWK